MLSTKKLLRQLPSEDVSWQVAPPRSTQRTGGNNPTVWHGFDRGGDGLAASLAPNGEVAEPGLGQVPHRNSIGEYEAKICTAGSHHAEYPTLRQQRPLLPRASRVLARSRDENRGLGGC